MVCKVGSTKFESSLIINTFKKVQRLEIQQDKENLDHRTLVVHVNPLAADKMYMESFNDNESPVNVLKIQIMILYPSIMWASAMYVSK